MSGHVVAGEGVLVTEIGIDSGMNGLDCIEQMK
jgi:hypothetical protein